MVKKIKVLVTREEEINVPPFDEIDRTDLVIGVGEIYGRDGGYPRTDLGRWLFEGPGFIENVFLESDGSLYCSALPTTCESLKNTIRDEAQKIYSKLIDKYEPLFRKYNLKGFEDVKRLNISQEGLKDWLKSRWIPGEIIVTPERGVQNGNVGMFAHIWELGKTPDIKFWYRVDYYIDFPGKLFKHNMYGGTQSPEEIRKWGKKIFTPKSYPFKTKPDRDIAIKDAYEKFKKGELVGFD